jgi:hypothetical protein
MHTFDTIVVSSGQSLIELAEAGELDKLLTTARRILITDITRYGLSENFTMTVHAAGNTAKMTISNTQSFSKMRVRTVL